jgi:hypothetical protein
MTLAPSNLGSGYYLELLGERIRDSTGGASSSATGPWYLIRTLVRGMSLNNIYIMCRGAQEGVLVKRESSPFGEPNHVC